VAAGLGSTLAALPNLSSASAATAEPGRSAQDAKNDGRESERGISLRYLEAGLASLANAWRGYWGNGHYGAATISACFMARDLELDARACRAIEAELDAFREAGKSHFEFDTPKEEATPERVAEIVRSLETGIDQSRAAGHDLIFASLALKAFHHAPALAKPQWIESIVQLTRHLRERFGNDADTDFNRAHPIAKWQTPQELVESTFACFMRPTQGGPVGLIHGITHADAVAELWDLGYESLGARGGEALKVHINLDPALAEPEPPLAEAFPDSPLSHRFWENPAVRKQVWGFRGHNFKFAYSYWRRRAAIRDEALRSRCDARALAVIGTVCR